MTSIIVGLLSIPAEVFLVALLSYFVQIRQQLQSQWSERPKVDIAPLQLVGPIAIALWSEGTWDRFLSSAKDSNFLEETTRMEVIREYGAAA